MKTVYRNLNLKRVLNNLKYRKIEPKSELETYEET